MGIRTTCEPSQEQQHYPNPLNVDTKGQGTPGPIEEAVPRNRSHLRLPGRPETRARRGLAIKLNDEALSTLTTRRVSGWGRSQPGAEENEPRVLAPGGRYTDGRFF